MLFHSPDKNERRLPVSKHNRILTYDFAQDVMRNLARVAEPTIDIDLLDSDAYNATQPIPKILRELNRKGNYATFKSSELIVRGEQSAIRVIFEVQRDQDGPELALTTTISLISTHKTDFDLYGAETR